MLVLPAQNFTFFSDNNKYFKYLSVDVSNFNTFLLSITQIVPFHCHMFSTDSVYVDVLLQLLFQCGVFLQTRFSTFKLIY